MEKAFSLATVWIALALISSFLAVRFRISTALVEITVGMLTGWVAQGLLGFEGIGANESWLVFIAATGSMALTFLAGAELDPVSFRSKTKEVTVVGLMGFIAPFLGCAAIARFALHWSTQASLLAGVALSTTSMAVVYAVMLELGFNKTEFGKGILGSCFVNDLGTVIALGLLFTPFTYKTIIFLVASVATFIVLPTVTSALLSRFNGKPSEVETKWILLILFGLGSLAVWAEGEAVLPAYVAGMVLAGSVGKDHTYIRRLRTVVLGFMTPFFFIRAGSFVSLPTLISAPLIFFVLLMAKVASKILGLFPVISLFRRHHLERWYYTLLMSTGLTFGTISALFGFAHGIISQEQYSHLVTVVIASALIPTIIANTVFIPKHLFNEIEKKGEGAY